MQNETRLDVMVESPTHPAIRIVAVLAVASQSPVVYVIGFVACKAGGVLVGKCVIAMAGLTRSDRVKPE